MIIFKVDDIKYGVYDYVLQPFYNVCTRKGIIKTPVFNVNADEYLKDMTDIKKFIEKHTN